MSEVRVWAGKLLLRWGTFCAPLLLGVLAVWRPLAWRSTAHLCPQRNRSCTRIPAPSLLSGSCPTSVTCLFSVLPRRPAPKTSPTALTQEGQGPPWAPRESPAKGMSVKLIVPLQDGGPRPRRVAPFAVVNLTRVRCIQAAISQASVSGPVQARAGPQSEGPSRAGREGGQARARGEERLAFLGCLSSPPSLPAISWPLTDKRRWHPARAGGFPRRGSVWVHSPNPEGRTHKFQAPHPTAPLPTVDTGLCDFQGEGQGCCNSPSTLTQDRHHPTEKDLPGSAEPRGL